MSLAAKLPYDHPFAGGFSGIGSQPLPTDADALDYLARVKAADGAGVEVGVAVAVSAFVAALKADDLWESIGSSCLLSGPRTLAGALVPLRGDAPTAYGFVDGDYDREGLTGDGTSYLDSNRANNADPQDDNHNAVYVASVALGFLIGSSGNAAGLNWIDLVSSRARFLSRSNSALHEVSGTLNAGLYAHSRGSSSAFQYYSPQGSGVKATASQAPNAANLTVFAYTNDGVTFFQFSTAKLAFYSAGTSLDLAKLNTHITAYVTAIGASL